MRKSFVKRVLRTLHHQLNTGVEAGVFSARVWAILLFGGVSGLFLLATYHTTPEPMTHISAAGLVEATPTLLVLPLDAPTLLEDAPTAVPTAVYEPLIAPQPLNDVTPALLGARRAEPTPVFKMHPVAAGDTLFSIAAQYGISTESLLIANDIRAPDNLEPGTQLLIPPPDGLRIPVVVHEVQAGQTLLSIATKYGSSVNEIVSANPGLTRASPLDPGHMLAVPVVFYEGKPLPTDATEEGRYHIVQYGDTPLTIAARYGIPVEVLMATNSIADPSLLMIGQQLYIPPEDDVTLGFPVILHQLTESDTLLGLATRYGSSVKDILAINPDLVPSQLREGQSVAIPIIFYHTPLPASQPGGSGEPPAPIPIMEPSAPLVTLQNQMVGLTNLKRQVAGLPPYQFDRALTQVAVDHASNMVRWGYFSHVTPDGETLRDRVRAGGVPATEVGENIQRNSHPPDEAIPVALEWFMSSSPHRRNILHPTHNRIGVGIVEGPPGMYTIVLVFAAR